MGSAPCLFDDVESALTFFPGAHLMLINGACTAYRNAEHVLAGHTDKAEHFATARRQKFPDAPRWRLHANWRSEHERKEVPLKYPSVTDWHGPLVSTGATSAGKAARIGLLIGYDMVVLCGCPMNWSGYFDGEAKVRHDCARIGDPIEINNRTIRRYRESMARRAITDFKGKVFSMSGFTREVLGPPPC